MDTYGPNRDSSSFFSELNDELESYKPMCNGC